MKIRHNIIKCSSSFFKAIHLCILLLFRPEKFRALEEKDNRAAKNNPVPRSLTVRHAFISSGLLVLFFGGIGCGVGIFLGIQLICAGPQVIGWLQVIGTCLLLWGTLFVRGWEIQSIDGITLTERVNQWLYRFLCCIGTAVIVLSLFWPQCANTG